MSAKFLPEHERGYYDAGRMHGAMALYCFLTAGMLFAYFVVVIAPAQPVVATAVLAPMAWLAAGFVGAAKMKPIKMPAPIPVVFLEPMPDVRATSPIGFRLLP